jgi:C4-dicarboxylate-specific signal transduction histidine kinase
LFYKKKKDAILGRLIPIIVHEVNNPMQAISGAAALGLEEVENPASVSEYFTLIENQSKRVMALTALVRSLYSSARTNQQLIDVFHSFDAIMLLIKDDLNRNGVHLEIVPPDSTLFIQGNESEFQLALLNIMLDLDAWMNLHGVKSYQIRFEKKTSLAIVDFLIPDQVQFDLTSSEVDQSDKLDLVFVSQLIAAQQGKISHINESGQSLLRLEIPLFSVNG